MTYWRTLRWSAWLGWRIDSNWASPWLFLLYVLVKPLAGSLLLVCMYLAARAAAADRVDPNFLPFLFLSTTCFLVIGGVTMGMCLAVVTDRESYGMLKYIRIAPVPLRSYLIGRGLSRAGQAGLGALLTIGLGLAIFPEFRAALTDDAMAWLFLPLFLVLGVLMLIAIGLILASMVLNMARYGGFFAEGVTGLLFLLTGAAFPIDLLPSWLRPLSLALPPTYWLEGMRRALLGPGGSRGEALAGISIGQLTLALAAGTLVLWLIAHFVARWSEARAWRLGRYEENTGN